VSISTTPAESRKVKRARRRSRSPVRLSAASDACAEGTVPFEFHGEALSDEAIEALARLLLAIAEQDGAGPTGPSGAPARDDGRRELARK